MAITFKTKNSIRKVGKKSIDDIWASIVNEVFAFPKSTDTELFKKFGNLCSIDSFSVFAKALAHRNITDVRKSAKQHKAPAKPLARKDSLELNKVAIESFNQKKKRRANIHLNAMDGLIDNIHTQLKNESGEMMEGKVGLGVHIDHASSAHKLASSVYGLDKDKDVNSAKVNLHLIASFDPTNAQLTEDVIDI